MRARNSARFLAVCVVGASLAGCFAVRQSRGGGEDVAEDPRRVNPADLALPPGYAAEAVATGLTFPTGVCFDRDGNPCVVEAGYSYGEVWLTPRLVRVLPGGSVEEIARGDNPPWNGVDGIDGTFFVAEGGHAEGGRILRIEDDGRGEIGVLVSGLPSFGDHHTNGPVVRDGWVYFGQGTATNSGVVGVDNFEFGWLGRRPDFCDVPARDVVLAGVNLVADNPLTQRDGDHATTGAYVPFGTPTTPGQTVPGRLPATGAIMRVRVDGGNLELVAWGLRNPYGLAFDPRGELFVVENSFDARGSRPVFGSGDVVWRIEPGAWYGWPDFHAGQPLNAEGERYAPPGEEPPRLLLAEHPGEVPEPAAVLAVHAGAGTPAIATGRPFGDRRELFVPLFGDMAPTVGKVLAPVGYKVVRVDPETGVVRDFATNAGKEKGPASRVGSGGFERPLACRFSPDGSSLYVVDFGVMTMTKRGPDPRPGTGVLWRIRREGP